MQLLLNLDLMGDKSWFATHRKLFKVLNADLRHGYRCLDLTGRPFPLKSDLQLAMAVKYI